MGQMLLQNATAILLQIVIEVYYKCVRFFITKCDSYYKLRRFYYKMRQVLQNATFITNCDSTHIMKHIFDLHFLHKNCVC